MSERRPTKPTYAERTVDRLLAKNHIDNIFLRADLIKLVDRIRGPALTRSLKHSTGHCCAECAAADEGTDYCILRVYHEGPHKTFEGRTWQP